MTTSSYYDKNAVAELNRGGIIVGRTDTIYGLLARSDKPSAVERIYLLKNRNQAKPCIILINNTEQLTKFGIIRDDIERAKPFWPAPITLILQTKKAPEYLSRGGSSLAFRLPDSREMRKLIAQTGPLVAPSANPEGMPPALTLNQAKSYFSETIDFYVGDNHIANSQASTILELKTTMVKQIR